MQKLDYKIYNKFQKMKSKINRRRFLNTLSTIPIIIFSKPKKLKEYDVDIAIIGGGTGGVASALSASENGARVVITEETEWLGGQFTSQGVPPDENPWVETYGSTERYKKLRNAIREYYRKNYPIKNEYRDNPYLNPGNGNVSKLCHEPRVSAIVIDSLLHKYERDNEKGQPQLIILRKHKPLKVLTKGDRVQAVCVLDLENGEEIWLRAKYFVDATETGELLPLAKIEYVTGIESQRETGEPHAPTEAQPKAMQACTWCFAMEYIPGADFTIDKPQNYEFWKSYVPNLDPPWPGPLFSFTTSHPITLEPRTLPFDPEGITPNSWWRYRQILDKSLFDPSVINSSVTLVNWPQNDYFIGTIIENDDPQKDKYHEKKAKELSLCLFYWLQNDAPRPDGGSGWKGLRLRGDVLGTNDGFAIRPYIRESRRIKAEFTICEQHIGKDARKELFKGKDCITPEFFYDSVGIGYYRIDLHPRTNGKNYLDIDSLPFQIPLGALIPVRVENLLPACKNIGTTHITNGAYRLHQIEWHIGEAVGCLLTYCLNHNFYPREVRNSKKKLESFQKFLQDNGIPLHWKEEAIQRYGKI